MLHDFAQIRAHFPQCLLMARECVEIRLVPDDGELRIEIKGELAGILEPLETKFDGDTYAAGWSRDEKSILIMAYSYRSELWKVQRQK